MTGVGVDVAGKRVLVVGLGLSGFSAARVLAGLNAKVRATEARSDDVMRHRAEVLSRDGVEVELGGHDLDAFDADLAVLSPGIPPHAEIVRDLIARGIQIVGEIELASRFAKADLIAVTGTNGKTTTTSLIGTILAEAGIPSAVAGNIGTPLMDVVLEVPSSGAIALEVSSFQLAAVKTFHPKIAVVLNVAEDHTDWHGSFRDYAAAKARIVENQTADDVVVYNADDDVATGIAAKARSRRIPFSAARSLSQGVSLSDEAILLDRAPIAARSDVALVGTGGLEDTLAAVAATIAYEVDEQIVARALKGFRPLSHRLQVIAIVDDVTYIDDSKATNPHATLSAVRGLRDVVLIAGGRSKGIDLSPLATTVPPVIAVVAIGEASAEIQSVFDQRVAVVVARDMDDAVRSARRLAVPEGSVLLSPGCASLDMYTDYAERGEAFARAVGSLIGRDQPESKGRADGNA